MAAMLVELGRSVRRQEWVAPPFDRSGIVLPWSAGPECLSPSPDGYVCNRKAGHGARHAACVGDGDVIAVWPQEVAEPCS